MRTSDTTQHADLVRSLRDWSWDGARLRGRAAALPGLQRPELPGWLTGEPLPDQGIEVAMPNLPRDLPLPDPIETDVTLHVEPLGPRTVRIVCRPGGHDATPALDGLGIVVYPSADPSGWELTEETTEDATKATTATTLRLAHGSTVLEIVTEPLSIRLLQDGHTVLWTAERVRQVAGFPLAPALRFGQDGPGPGGAGRGTTTLAVELGPDETIHGLGEQFGPLARNGQHHDLHVADALGTSSGRAYKPVPLWHTTAGATALLNTGARVRADVGHTLPSVLELEVGAPELDLVLIADPDPLVRLTEYTRLTGRSALPPLWAFGLWLGRCRYRSRSELLDAAHGLRAHDVPADVMHLDPDWLVLDRLNTDFRWNHERFGDPEALCADLGDLGLRLSVWEVPYLDDRSPLTAEAAAAGHLVRTPEGELAELAGTPTPEGVPRRLVDMTSPDAVAWWQSLHDDLLAAGVAAFTTDFGEGCPEEVATHDGTSAAHAHNLYPLRYNRAVFEGLRARTAEPLVYGRSGWAGSHRYPAQWGGDPQSSVDGLRATVRGGLSYALSAPGFWGHDVGGFYGPDLTPELYVRWAQFGALSPLMRAHGLRPREPWVFGETALRIVRDWVRLRYRLLPTLWQAAVACAERGLPMLRSMALAHPGQRGVRGLDDQYLLGGDLLVVPVLDDGPGPVERTFWAPPGRWTDLLSGESVAGPAWHTWRVGLERIPVLVRDGAVLATVDEVDGVRSTDDLRNRPWTLHRIGSADASADRGDGSEDGENDHGGGNTVTDFDGRSVPVERAAGLRPGWRIVDHQEWEPWARL